MSTPYCIRQIKLIPIVVISVFSLTSCGFYSSTSPGPGDEVWTCSNVSAAGQQYMQTARPEDLDCGETGEPILLSPAS